MEKDKKTAAAIAAVYEYIQSEEELLCMQAAQAPAVAAAAPEMPSQPGFSPWGLSGRQEIMQMRHLMQMKVFNKLR
jgi:hypothetical protein